MCLYKTHRFPKISRKPIQVYKVFGLGNDMLITPFQFQCYKVGETIKSKNSWLKGIFKNEIWGEGVHACRTKIEAFCMAQQYSNGCVYLCEIPPFTPYWVSDWDDIAASKMIIKEKVVL